MYFDKNRLQQIDRHAAKRVQERKLLGACSAIADENGIVYTCYKGCADMNGTPMTDNCLFRMASMTKPVTAVATMIQAERGYFHITDPIGMYLPEMADLKLYDGTPAQPVTIRHLLSHSSGICQDDFGNREFEADPPVDGDTLETMVKKYGKMRLSFRPGEWATYSPIAGFDILARLVEVTSGMKYSDFLAENLTGPLGMKDTTFHPTPEQRKRIVELVDNRDNDLKPGTLDTNFSGIPESVEAGGAGLISSLADYMRFARMLLGRGQLDGVRIITPRSVEMMSSPALPYIPKGMGPEVQWGLGMRVITHLNGYSAPLSVGTFGWSGAYGTHFFVDPVLKVAAVYMNNMLDGGGAGAPTAFEFENDVISSILE